MQDLVGGEGVTDVARRTTAVPGSAIPNFLPAGLWEAVLIARAARAQRRKHPSPGHDAAAHTEPLDGLESHVASLQEQARPVSYVLRDELCIAEHPPLKTPGPYAPGPS